MATPPTAPSNTARSIHYPNPTRHADTHASPKRNPTMPHKTHRRRTLPLATLAATTLATLLALPTAHANAATNAAQSQPDNPAAAAQQTAETVRQWRADNLTRFLLERIRQLPDPTTIDFAVTALGLRIAQTLRPDDPQLIRREINAWNAAGDRERSIQAIKRLLTLTPNDQIARLRVLSDAAQKRQTVDDRLDFYLRALDAPPEDLAPAIRSRLALDAALLAREAADEQRFIELLTTATTLDVTNKAAASLFATVFLDRAETPLERVEILANVVLADPLDPAAHNNLAQELMSHGAYEQALRFLNRAREAEGRDSVPGILDRAHCLWQTQGPDAALELFARLQQTGDILYAQSRARQIAQSIDPGPEIAQLIQPPIELSRLVLLTAYQQDAQGRAFQGAQDKPTPPNLQFNDPTPAPALDQLPPFATRRAYARTLAAIQQNLDDLADPALLQQGFPEETLQAERRSLRLQRVWTRLFAGLDIDAASNELAQIADEAQDTAAPLEPDAIQRFQAWIAALNGDQQSAIQQLQTLAQSDASAAWALATAHHTAGNRREAAIAYLNLATRFEQSLLAAAARTRAEALLQTALAPSQTARELNHYGKRFAPWIDEFTQNPSRAIAITTDPGDPVIQPLDRPRLTITLRNQTVAPIAIGAQSPIPPKALLTPQLTIGDQAIPADLIPVFIRNIRSELDVSEDEARAAATEQTRNLSRRMLEILDIQQQLRLNPRESISITVWPARGFYGAWLDQDATARARLRYRLTLGFQQAQQGELIATPNAVTAQTPMLTRLALPPVSPENPLNLENTSGTQLLEQVLRASSAITISSRPNAPTSSFTTTQLYDALARRIPTMTPDELNFTLGRLALSGQLVADQPSTDSPIRQTALDAILALPNPDPATLAVLIMALPQERGSPLLQTALNHQNQDLAAIADIVSDVLTARAEQQSDTQTQSPAPDPTK